jgi:hypothetical protein
MLRKQTRTRRIDENFTDGTRFRSDGNQFKHFGFVSLKNWRKNWGRLVTNQLREKLSPPKADQKKMFNETTIRLEITYTAFLVTFTHDERPPSLSLDVTKSRLKIKTIDPAAATTTPTMASLSRSRMERKMKIPHCHPFPLLDKTPFERKSLSITARLEKRPRFEM